MRPFTAASTLGRHARSQQSWSPPMPLDPADRTASSGPDGRTHRRSDRPLLGLEIPHGPDFDDPREEWRRLFSELLGTFLLVVVGAGGAVGGAASHGAIERGAAVVSPAVTVIAASLFMGWVSGAHLIPAVTIAFAVRGDFPWRRVPGYLVVQLAGSVLACLLLWAMFGKVGMLGATEP